MSRRTDIGSSLLPSSNPQILQPLPFDGGVLQVVPDHERDTHDLVLNGDKVIASHPNGFSCHNLAVRIIGEGRPRALAQAAYIIACGGSADTTEIMNICPKRK